MSRRIGTRGGTTLLALGVLTLAVGALPQTAAALCMARPLRSPHYYRAQRLLRQGRTQEAVTLLGRAARSQSQARRWIGQAWHQAGYRALRDSRFREAARAFRESLRYRPNYGYAAMQLLRALRGAGRLEAAVRELSRFSPTLRHQRQVLLEEARLRAMRHEEGRLQEVLSRLRARGWLRDRYLREIRTLARGPLLTAPGPLDI